MSNFHPEKHSPFDTDTPAENGRISGRNAADDDVFLAPLFDPKADFGTEGWRAAAATLWSEMAALSFEHGKLAERLRTAPAGLLDRLAVREALDLVWWNGEKIGLEPFILWQRGRHGSHGAGSQAFHTVAWLSATLRRPLPRAGLTRLPPSYAALPPILRGAALFHQLKAGWRQPDTLKAAAWAARVAAPQGWPWLPIARAHFKGLEASGGEERKLGLWLDSAHHAAQLVLREIEAFTRWHHQAQTATKDLSGRTAALLIAALVPRLALDTVEAAKATGASRAAVERNLHLLTQRGLLRELTGQGRFRLWGPISKTGGLW